MTDSSGLLSRQAHSTPLWLASRTLLARHEEEFFARWEKTIRRFQQDDVHDLRVASRRLREGLALFSPCFPGKKNAKVVKRVKRVTELLGGLRNTDEAFLFFSELTPEESGASRQEIEQLLTSLRRERELAHKKLKKELRALDPEPLRNDLMALRTGENLFARRDELVDPFTSIAFFAYGAFQERAQPLTDLLPPAVERDNHDAQHSLRIAIKKLRYRLEILAPLLKSGYDELHEALKSYQDLLGKLHDLVLFHELVRERLAEGAGRQRLLQLLEERRNRLHDSFLELLSSFPVESIGAKIRDAL